MKEIDDLVMCAALHPEETKNTIADSVIQAPGYQRWVAMVASSADWRVWCLKTLMPDEGAEIAPKYKMFARIYLEYDTEGGFVEPMERAIEFVLWLIETQYSDHRAATARLLKGYVKSHSTLIERVANEQYKDSKIYPHVMHLISRYKAASANSITSDCEDNKKATKKRNIIIPEKLSSDIESITNALVSKGICEIKNGERWFILGGDESGASTYSWLVYRLTQKYWGKDVPLKWAEVDTLFKHRFKTSSAQTKYSAWHKDYADKPHRRRAIDLCIDKRWKSTD